MRALADCRVTQLLLPIRSSLSMVSSGIYRPFPKSTVKVTPAHTYAPTTISPPFAPA